MKSMSDLPAMLLLHLHSRQGLIAAAASFKNSFSQAQGFQNKVVNYDVGNGKLGSCL
jgi:hypothetical protein